MGLRSWLTPVRTYEEFEQVLQSIEDNPYANGVHYVVLLESDELPFEPGLVVVAWSGDGSGSLQPLQPAEAQAGSWFLDNFIEECPEWHTEPGGPAKFGSILTTPEEVRDALAR